MSDLDRTPSMFARLGQEEGCRRLAFAFYAKVEKDPILKPLFPGKSLRCASEELAAFLVQFFEGDEGQSQYRWWISLKESHARVKFDSSHRAAWVRQMTAALREVLTDEQVISALTDFFIRSSQYLLGQPSIMPSHAELAKRWESQLALDELVDQLKKGLDEEAIQIAQKFSSQRSVFVGILAKMMETAREEPVGFVIEAVHRDNELKEHRFNGRTLLHFASGTGCLSVVQLLLSVGADPDVLDSGAHTPLYRVAGAHQPGQGRQIVIELVRAGAKVDQCSGVSRSTPLHQAARHGNLEVAKALLEAGASRTARDKKGLTPLDRARNCRRHEVAALLSAT